MTTTFTSDMCPECQLYLVHLSRGEESWLLPRLAATHFHSHKERVEMLALPSSSFSTSCTMQQQCSANMKHKMKFLVHHPSPGQLRAEQAESGYLDGQSAQHTDLRFRVFWAFTSAHSRMAKSDATTEKTDISAPHKNLNGTVSLSRNTNILF